MPDKGESPVEENVRRLIAATDGDLPDYGTRMLDARQGQLNSVGKKPDYGGITFRKNYKGPTVEIRFPKWVSSTKLWKTAPDLVTAKYVADLVFYFTGRRPFHFPKRNFQFPALCLSNGEVLNTREACEAYVAKIAKSSTYIKERKEYKELLVKMADEMEDSPEVVQLRNEPSSEDGAGNPILEVHPVAAAASGDDEEENSTPMEVDSVSEEVVQLVKPTLYVDPSSMIDFASSSYGMDVDFATTYIPSFSMDDYLYSDCQSLGALHRCSGENSGPISSNLKGFVDSLDKEELEICELTGPSDWEQFSPPPPPTMRLLYASYGYCHSSIQITSPYDETGIGVIENVDSHDKRH